VLPLYSKRRTKEEIEQVNQPSHHAYKSYCDEKKGIIRGYPDRVRETGTGSKEGTYLSPPYTICKDDAHCFK